MIKLCCPKLHVKDPSTLSKTVKTKAKDIFGEIVSIIELIKEDILSIALTSDIWTTRTNESFLFLTTTFIDRDFYIHNYVPFVNHFKAKHSGPNIASTLNKMVELLGISGDSKPKLFCVTDNASNYKSAFRNASNISELKCILHTVQLAVNDAFKEDVGIQDILDKSRSIAKLVHKSNVAKEELKSSAKKWI